MKFFTYAFYFCLGMGIAGLFSGAGATWLIGSFVCLGTIEILEKLEELKPKC